MRKVILMGVLIISATLVLAGCAQTSSSSSPIQPSNSATTDSSLKDQVQAKLNSDMQLKEAGLNVEADAAKNQVTLSGNVESEALRTKAVDLAKGARAGLIVIDRIDVKPTQMSRSRYTEEQAKSERVRAKGIGDKIGDSADDAWIHMKIVAKLVANSKTPERKINVDVVNDAVTLRGTVDSTEQKTEAERIAKDTDGVKSVHNLLKVSAGTKSA
jgi:osmotically-inducible protein OsmY